MSKLQAVLALADARLIDDWRAEIRRLWSIRVALAWAAVSGIYSAWDAFQAFLPAWLFGALSVIMSVSIVGARLTRQAGAVDE